MPKKYEKKPKKPAEPTATGGGPRAGFRMGRPGGAAEGTGRVRGRMGTAGRRTPRPIPG
jgi:hypothetical protein